MESIGRVMDSSYAGSEGLGLGGDSVLSLVRLGDGLVRDLASTTVDRSSVDSVGNRSSVDSVGNRSSVDNRGSISRGIGILSLTVISDCSDVSVDGVGGVANMLGAAVREVDTVRTLGIASSVTGLGSIEVGGGVVVSDGVLVCIGGDLVRVDLSVVGRGSVGHNRGVVGRGSVNYRSHGMGNGVSSNKSMSTNESVSSNKSVSTNKSVSSNDSVSTNKSMSTNKSVSSNNSMSSDDTMTATVGSMESVRRVMDSSYCGSEGLGLGCGSVLSLERLGYRLVRDLASTNSYMSSNKSVSSNNSMTCNKSRSSKKPMSSNNTMTSYKSLSSNKSVSSHKTVTNNCSLTEMLGQTSLSCVTDGIRRGYRGDRGSECLGLASGPRLSLERLGD